MCPNDSIPSNKKGYMEFDLYRQIIDQVYKYANDIYLFHRGESLMHPDFCEMVKYAKNNGLFTKLHTNTTLLTKEKSIKLLKSELDFLSFSFEGFDKDIYEKIRVGADFEETLSNIMNFLRLKKEYEYNKPYTVLQILDIPGMRSINTADKKKFKKKFASFPLEEIRIIPAHNWAGNINLNNSDIPVSGICTFPWYSLTILYDGTVVPCPQDFLGKLNLGNVKTHSINTIWNNEKMLQLRTKMVEGRYKELTPCNTCDRIFRETIFGSMIPKQNLLPFISENLFGYDLKKLVGKILRACTRKR